MPITVGQKWVNGFGMIEVMVALLVIMVGLLGMAALQGKSFTTQVEAYQRAQAIVIAKDMVARINATTDPLVRPTYETTDGPLGTNDDGKGVQNCTGLSDKDLDFCQWHNMLLGAAETGSDGTNVGAMIGARGCIDYIASSPDRFLVTVAWQGVSSTVAPSVPCGQGEYDDDRMRRVITLPITIADLGT